MNAPLISIIIPVYNVEQYLRKCVDSILAQTYANIEVILVDDGSPDGCPAICDEYAKKDSRVVVIHRPHAGVSSARNTGLDTAKGEYIGFVDSDDWIEPDMYEVLCDVIKASGADMAASYDCMGDFKPVKISKDEYVIFSPKEAMTKLVNNQCELRAVWGKLFTKKLVNDIRFSPAVAVAEDILFVAEAIAKSRKIVYINYQSYHYVVRADSATHEFKEKFWTFLHALDMIVDVVKDFDAGLGDYAEKHVIDFDILVLNEVVSKGKLTKEAYQKIVTHIRKYKSRDSWETLPFDKKCSLCLLLTGRLPFIIGRRLFRSITKIFRKVRTWASTEYKETKNKDNDHVALCPNDLRDAQTAAFHVLQYVDRFCKECDCHYFLDGGTLLGAIRHKKFIPWDDDIDILMPRCEYEKLKQYCLSGKLPAGFEIANADNNINGFFYDFIPRITVKDSRCHTETASDRQFGNQQNRIGLDIFILDTVPQSRTVLLLYTLILVVFYGLAMGHRGVQKPKENGFAVFVLSLTGRFIPLKVILSLRERFIKLFANGKSSRVMVTNRSMKGFGKTYRKEWFAESIPADFESSKFPVPAEYENILNTLYGNYFAVPQADQRVPAHISEGFYAPDWLIKEI